MRSREEIMKVWDKIRSQIDDYPGASLPRDTFESIIDEYEEEIQYMKELLKMNEYLRTCPKCNGRTNTYRHPNAKIWCNDCGYVIREEGHPTPKYIEIKDTYKNNIDQ